MIDIIRWCTQSQHTLSTHTREIHVEADRTREVKLMIADSIRIIYTQAIGSLVGWRSNVTIRLTESVVCNWYAHYANIFQSICIVFIQTWRHIVHSAYQSQWWEVSFSGGLLTYFTHHCPVIFCFFFFGWLVILTDVKSTALRWCAKETACRLRWSEHNQHRIVLYSYGAMQWQIWVGHYSWLTRTIRTQLENSNLWIIDELTWGCDLDIEYSIKIRWFHMEEVRDTRHEQHLSAFMNSNCDAVIPCCYYLRKSYGTEFQK